MPAPARLHGRGVYSARRNIAAFTGAIRVPPAVHRLRHLPTQNDVRGFRGMRVIGIRRVGRILPDVGMAEAFLFERSRQLLFIHRIILANAGPSAAPKTASPSLRHWGTPQKVRGRLQVRSAVPT